MAIKRGMKKTLDVSIKALKESSSPITGKEDIAKVASISANNEEIGNIISEAMEKVTNNGVITLEESKTSNTQLNIVEGMQFDRGYISPYMVTNQEKMEAIIDNPYILLTDKIISNISEILPILEKLIEIGGKLVIICDDMETEALSTVILNKLRGILNVVVIKAPSFGNMRKLILEDISILTGGTVIDTTLGMILKDVEINNLRKSKTNKSK